MTGRTRVAALLALSVALAALGVVVARLIADAPGVPGFTAQACALPSAWLKRTQRGYFEPRSGHISLLPKRPAYLASGGGGWSHSGPWSYLQDVPLVFFGPGVVAARGDVARPVTLADVAPTLSELVGLAPARTDGRVLPEVATARAVPRLIVVVVWDGGGRNVLRHWAGAWPNLARIMREGVSYTNASVGSSPSVTPAVHTTLGTGVYPRAHGITGVRVRDERGNVVDAFLGGRSGRFLRAATFAERWDEANGNEALVSMIGYEPWHLGMIGKGAERPHGDKDGAVWLDRTTNEWVTERRHYDLPDAVAATGGLRRDLKRLDARDGEMDGAWGEHAILDDRARVEETPAFVAFHNRAMMNLIRGEGYGDDRVTDLLFTNFKQIDRVGHYFNMASEEVRQLVVETDRQLGALVEFLDDEVGAGGYLLVVTADHGQQLDARAVDGYGIDPRAVEDDIDRHFGGAIARAVWPTEVFLRTEVMEDLGVTVADVARYLGGYRLADNTDRPVALISGAGRFGPQDRLFELAVPARMLPYVRCDGASGSPPGH